MSPRESWTVSPGRIRRLLRRLGRAEEQGGTPYIRAIEQVREPLLWFLHDTVMRRLPGDFEPWGERLDAERGGDCSCDCLWFLLVNNGLVSTDWGVCCNPQSARVGLLTWEHQGCAQYERR